MMKKAGNCNCYHFTDDTQTLQGAGFSVNVKLYNSILEMIPLR